MKIVVLAGGTSTERDVSIVSGTGICGALRQKGHQAILVDVFCGQEEVDWEDPFPAEYDVEKAAAYIRMDPRSWILVLRQAAVRRQVFTDWVTSRRLLL